jgi:hypothetical protein
MQTPPGKKLLGEGVLTRSADGRKATMERMLELQRDCLRTAAQTE